MQTRHQFINSSSRKEKCVFSTKKCSLQLSSRRRANGRVPSIRFAHRPPTERLHNADFHLLNVALQLLIEVRVAGFLAAVVPDPGADDEDGQGHGDDEVDPEPVGDDGIGSYLLRCKHG
jgi:hypothetical protein